MKTLVEVVARRGPDGGTVLPVLQGSGQLAARRTGERRIHLVSTAFGPLGGDVAVVRLHIEAGARLEVCSVAAAVCMPSQEPAPSSAELYAEVADGAQLDLVLEPMIVAAGAEHRSVTEIVLARAARLRFTEQVLLGRHADVPGRWLGTTRNLRAGRPLLHTTVDLGPGSPMWRAPTTPRAYATDLVLDNATAASRTGQDALLLPLPGGSVSTAWGQRLEDVLARITRLTTS